MATRRSYLRSTLSDEDLRKLLDAERERYPEQFRPVTGADIPPRTVIREMSGRLIDPLLKWL